MAKEVALTIRKAFERASKDMVALFGSVPTGNVCDAQGRSGALDYRIQALTKAIAFAGTAVTVDAGPRDNLAPWAALEVAVPGDVIVIKTHNWTGGSVIGDRYVGMARNRGVVAVVTDGVIRDVPGCDEAGIPVFAVGVSPNSPQKNGPGSVGLTIECGGVVIEPGDVVVGDQDGAVVVSRARIDEIAEELRIIVAKEKQMEASVQAGDGVPGWLAEAYTVKGVRWIDE